MHGVKLAVGSKQPLYGAGLKPALGRIPQERAGMKPAPTAAPCWDFGRYDNSETVSDADSTSNPKAARLLPPFFSGVNDILWPPVTEELR